MTALSDHELLAEFARSESGEAFAVLVSRYVNLVYSAALRYTGNPHHAQEISQAVFIVLARKAGSLRRGVVLSGWLYQTARLTAMNFMKGEIRRQIREQEAYMQSTLNEPDAAAWERIAPLLEEAMGDLGETDRNAVVLRFFENKSAAEVASALNLTEATAHKRVARALEKLRKIFTKRGVTLSAAGLAAAVGANSVQAAPAGLAATLATTAAQRTAISTTVTTLVKSTVKTMASMKLKIAIASGLALLLAGSVAIVAISKYAGSSDKVAIQKIVKQTEDAYAALSSYSDTGKVITDSSKGGMRQETTFSTRLQRPYLYHVQWTNSKDGLAIATGAVWSSGKDNYFVQNGPPEEKSAPQKMANRQMAIGMGTGVSCSAAANIPSAFFNDGWGNTLAFFNSDAGTVRKGRDEAIGGVACDVIMSAADMTKFNGKQKPAAPINFPARIDVTLWIGKQDHLIHKIQETIDLTSMKLPKYAQAEAKGIGSVTFTQINEDISVNRAFTTSDFTH